MLSCRTVAEIVNSTSTSSVYYLLYHILLLCPASIIDVPSDVVTRLKRSFDAGQTLGINARFLHANWRRQPTGGDDFRTTFVNQFTKSVLRNNCKHFSVASNFSKYEELAAKWMLNGFKRDTLVRSVSRGDYKFKNSL
ncbi:hypothetical protein POM88_049415 [Heracleum sosnowskyi]|uniref:Uncharacterized protein n=1 Tax=Heracleum sosnowskyi TaxID=360622 RepID=A0AAD8GXS8_9APIA|nr:hypothetical protein POM88_049415 [Heracleum sosnowskyi]